MHTRSVTNHQNDVATASDGVADLDLGAQLREVEENERNVQRSDGALKALDNKGVSLKHWKRANQTEQSFLDGLTKVGTFFAFLYFVVICSCNSTLYFAVVITVDVNGKMKWEKLLKEVPNPNRTCSRVGSERSDYVPLAYVAGSGPITQVKLELVNAMLCDWQVDLVMKKKPKEGSDRSCPYYSPSTQNQMLRTFYAHMAKHHGWKYTESNFKGWKGCVDGVLGEIYAQRLKVYVS